MVAVMGGSGVRVPLVGIALAIAVAACGRVEESNQQPVRKTPAPPEPPAPPPRPGGAPPTALPLPEAPPLPRAPRGLPPLASPEHNPTTPDKVELGRLLFFDPRLSGTGKTSCASCHQPERGWADGMERARTDAGHPNLRHTPSLFNVGYHREWTWDGGMPTLEAQILSHWKGQLGRRPEDTAGFLGRSPGYTSRFARAFSTGPDRDRVAEALAAYVRTVTSGDSQLDRHEAGLDGVLDAQARAGLAVFSKRAGCATCHPPPLYTDLGFHDRGVALDQRARDPGRMRVTADERQLGAFKTPGLRGLVNTAPYFHDGSAATLEAAVDAELARDRISLSPSERAQLLAFLRALSPELDPVARPNLPAAL
jgi:cytochrome c peroxidase